MKEEVRDNPIPTSIVRLSDGRKRRIIESCIPIKGRSELLPNPKLRYSGFVDISASFPFPNYDDYNDSSSENWCK